jgi:hypothetical protein
MVSVRLEQLSSPISLAHDPQATKLPCIYWRALIDLAGPSQDGRPISANEDAVTGSQCGSQPDERLSALCVPVRTGGW